MIVFSRCKDMTFRDIARRFSACFASTGCDKGVIMRQNRDGHLFLVGLSDEGRGEEEALRRASLTSVSHFFGKESALFQDFCVYLQAKQTI